MAKLRANLVNADALAIVANKLCIGEDIYIGKGTEQSGGRNTPSILGNAIEAIIGAIYIDKGVLAVTKFILNNFRDLIIEKAKMEDYSDPKTSLQEISVEKTGEVPVYKIVKETGPYHNRTFHVEAYVDNKEVGVGDGKSKKKAEQKAAAKALHKFNNS